MSLSRIMGLPAAAHAADVMGLRCHKTLLLLQEQIRNIPNPSGNARSHRGHPKRPVNPTKVVVSKVKTKGRP
jgi:hypothetical protein